MASNIKKNKSIQNTKERNIKMSKIVLRKVRKKIGIAFLVIGMAFLVLAVRIFLINYHSGDQYSKAVLDHQQYTSTVLSYKRGEIIDTKGTILAYSEKVYNLILDPKVILSDESYKTPTINALIKCFNLKQTDIETILATKPNSHYEKVLKSLTGDQIKEFTALMEDTKNNPYIKGVWFEDSYIRKYPFSSLACDVIGFASSTNGGEIGLENYYDESLSGTDGISYGYVDENLDIEKTTKEPIDGYNLVTTLDYSVQSIIEKHIKAFNEQYGSKNTAVVVMNPNNGEILGMASYPVFDLNNPRDLSKVYTSDQLSKMSDQDTNTALYSLWNNYCISSIFEPGSTYKPFTVSTALEENVVSTKDTFYCSGSEKVGSDIIHCWLTSGHGTETLEQAVMNSCNPAMMQIAAKIGVAKFSDYQARFGFGQKTGIDLPGEEAGITISGDKMTATDLATNSFGQSFNVNMIQMVAGFSSLINGGNYFTPHIVKRIEKDNGEVIKTINPTLVKQTITKSTSDTIRSILKSTVEAGTAMKAKVEGYSIAGKTGTAQKRPLEDKKYVISFMGLAPADNPKFVIYVVIDEPNVPAQYIGNSTPVLNLTNQILTDLLPYMNVFKDADEKAPNTTNSPVEAYNTSIMN